MKRESHGWNGTRLYTAWTNMKGRCYRKSMKGYQNYGGRGITVCETWKNSFSEFKDWALANGYDENAKPRECTLDRIDVNGNYEPSNCRWISNREQQNNSQYNHVIEYNGIKKTVAEWAEYCNISYKAMEKRFKTWSVEKAITTPKLSREDVTGARYKRARPVLQYSMSGDFIRRWDSISDACRESGFCETNIILCCKKKTAQAHSFVWCYEGECHKFEFKHKVKSVAKYDMNGNFICRYSSFTEAETVENIPRNSLRASCYQSNGAYKGYMWKIERYGDVN